jgi:hypothetical protein
MTEKTREDALRKWSNTPAVNPRYKGATPADMVRALRGEKPVCHAKKVAADSQPVKTAL